ncbi:FimV/HubP family polar landmark protein [Pseudomonas sp.]|uniref:FimV/HubP family polar landmark protein n=1 Tax=Pseudomonas sp. TaxID=306 RepID=UPI003C753B78
MVRVRKLVLAIAAASALSSGMAHALGLGEVTLQSALNQPLVAEIELLEVRDLASNEVLPTLASPEAFNKAGVDRQYFLTDLKFTPVLKPNGKSVIRVTSSKPMREPYLNFLVEVLWPNGRLLREYTLLLDPPLYTPQSVIPAAARLPVAAAAPAPRVQAPAVAPRPVAAAPAATAPVRPAAPTAPAAPAATPLEGNEYKTTANDTLWEIAQRVRDGGSVHQAMLAIQDLNPDAFVGGNINRLKNGQVLRLPDEQQIKSRAQGEAIAQVAEQNAAWREGRSVAASARQLDATKRTSAADTPAKVATGDKLKLVAADSGKATAGSDKGAPDSKALTDKLAVTQESLDSSRRENDELKGRMGDLQSQLDKLQRLIQLKDDQMAKLQADLAAQGKAAPVVPVAPAAVAETPVVAAEPAPVEPAPVVTAQEPAAAAPVVPAVPAEQDFNYSEEAAKPEVVAPEPAPVVVPAPEVVEPAAPAVATPPVEEVAVDSSAIDDLLANPMLLGVAGGGALLVLLVALMMLSRRNAMKEAELQESLAADEHAGELGGIDLPGDSFDGLADDLADSQQSTAAGEERVTAQTGDALGEADIYIAYGRFPQAAELLQGAINDEPQRGDLRLKLMEVYAEMGDRNGFARQENELREIGGSAAELDQIKAKYPAMIAAAGLAAVAAEESLDSFSLDDLTLDEPTAKAAVADQDDGFDLSLDDLESELDRDLQAAGDSAALNDLDSLSLDSDLDFSSPVEQANNTDDDLGFDLSLADTGSDSLDLDGDLADFSLDLDEPSKPSAAAEDDFLLSLDDEPSAAPVAPAPSFDLPAEEEAGGAFDLPADFDLSLNDEAPAQPSGDSFAAQLDEVNAELDLLADDLDQSVELDMPVAAASSAALDNDDDFDFLSGTDETATKLDLARAYIDMGDTEGARDILDEVITEGNEGQQQEARELIAKLV